MSADQRYPQLDGLRAIAVGLVVADHGAGLSNNPHVVPLLAPGPAGVRLFFVLSGLLITGILLRARGGGAHVWRAFYLRRALRIFPLAYAALLLAWFVGIPVSPWWYLTYASNIKASLVNSFDYGVGHFWSLAVEEQFYLIWPAVILLVPDRWLIKTMIALIVFSGVCRGWWMEHQTYMAAYASMPARLDSLATGGLCALLLHRRLMSPRSIVAWTVGIAVIASVTTWMLPRTDAIFGEWAKISICAAMIVAAVQDKPGGRWLAAPPLVYVGTISYGIYVLHAIVPFVIPVIERHFDIWLRFPRTDGLPRAIYMGVVTIIGASVSWYFFERPINSLKRYVPYRAHRSATHVNGDTPVTLQESSEVALT